MFQKLLKQLRAIEVLHVVDKNEPRLCDRGKRILNYLYKRRQREFMEWAAEGDFLLPVC